MPFSIGTIAIGSDHRARTIVDSITDHLESLGWTVHKHYGGSAESVDYPDIAIEVTSEIVAGEAAVSYTHLTLPTICSV